MRGLCSDALGMWAATESVSSTATWSLWGAQGVLVGTRRAAQLKDAGNTSQGCTYHIDSLYAVSVTSLGACRFYIHDEGWNIYSGPREWLKGTARFRKKVKELKKNRFFEPELFEWKEPEPGNSIYVPDGKGGWKEVMP